MTEGDLLKEITQTYQKFGWTLRSVVLTEKTRGELAGTLSLLAETAVVENSEINALWFSRISGVREAWELRLLSEAPFALIETFDQQTPAEERAKTFAVMLAKLLSNAPKFKV